MRIVRGPWIGRQSDWQVLQQVGRGGKEKGWGNHGKRTRGMGQEGQVKAVHPPARAALTGAQRALSSHTSSMGAGSRNGEGTATSTSACEEVLGSLQAYCAHS